MCVCVCVCVMRLERLEEIYLCIHLIIILLFISLINISLKKWFISFHFALYVYISNAAENV